jgi:hypothetical protein
MMTLANKTWFRCYTEITRDRKLRRLPPDLRWVWIAVMAIAKESPLEGRLLLSEGIPATIDDIADEAAMEPRETKEALDKFEQQNMLHVEDGVYVCTNWGKRNFESDGSTDRVMKHRAKKNGTLEVTLHETLQQRSSNGDGNNFETPPDTDTDTDLKINNNAPTNPDRDIFKPLKSLPPGTIAEDFFAAYDDSNNAVLLPDTPSPEESPEEEEPPCPNATTAESSSASTPEMILQSATARAG